MQKTVTEIFNKIKFKKKIFIDKITIVLSPRANGFLGKRVYIPLINFYSVVLRNLKRKFPALIVSKFDSDETIEKNIVEHVEKHDV